MKSKLPKDPVSIAKVKKWLSVRGNTLAKLSGALGYRSHSVVSQWITRGRIAERERERALQYIKENPKCRS